MPLVDPSTALPIGELRRLREAAVAELDEMLEILSDSPNATPARTARGATARALVVETLAWASRAPPPDERGALVAELNLLYDIGIVAAEYYKLFVRDGTPERPAGRI